MKTPHWNERDTTKDPVRCVDGLYYPLTARAWEERYAYALERVRDMEREAAEEKSTRSPTADTSTRLLQKYKDVVMVRLSDGHEEPLGTPTLFGKRHGVHASGISILLSNPQRRQAYGWTVKGRFPTTTNP